MRRLVLLLLCSYWLVVPYTLVPLAVPDHLMSL